MIISHRYKFIFIKTHKTAGSSMEMALGPLCGPDDIITSMEDNEHTGVPRNYHANTALGRAYAKSRLLRKIIDRRSPLLGPWFWEHMPATRVRELVAADVWNTYHKFCYERNPWEKVVSYYNWKKHGQGRSIPDFKTYVMTKTRRLPCDGDLYFDGGNCLMDEVLDYNGFLGSFAALCQRLAIPYDGVMPREKTGVKQEKQDYREYYDDETRDKIASLFPREIKLMGYRF